ncbi:helix-turn-helix domain-containing protein [Bacillus sp. FSL R5-0394]
MQRSMWMKLLLYGGLLSTIPVIVVGVFAYIQSTNQAEQRVENEKLQLMRQVQANIETVLTTVHHSLNNTIESPTMEAAIRTSLDGEDFLVYRDLRTELSKLQSFDTKVEETIVLNKDQNWLATNQGIRRLDSHVDYERYLPFFDLPYDTTWKLIANDSFTEPIIRRNCPYSLSLIKKLPARASEKFGLVFANIPMCTIQEMIGGDEVDDELMILDEHNRVIVHSDEQAVGKTLAELGFSEPVWTTEAAGQFTVDRDQEPFAITYSSSTFTGWKYVSVTPMDELMAETKSIGWFTFYVVLAIILLSALVVWLFSRKLYLPVQKLVAAVTQKENGVPTGKRRTEFQVIEDTLQELFSSKSMLEQELSIHAKQSMTLFLMRLYQGHFSEAERQERLKLYGLDSRMAKWHSYSLLVVHYEQTQKEEDQQEMDLLTFAMLNVAEDTIPDEYRLPAVWVDQLLVLFIGLETDSQEQGKSVIYQWSERLKSFMHHYLEADVSIGISAPFTDMAQTSTAYKEAKEALTHRLKFVDNVIINYESIQAKEKSSMFQYPEHLEEELLLALRLADEKQAYDLFNHLLAEVSEGAHHLGEVRVSFMRLLNRMLQLYQQSGLRHDQGVLLPEGTLYQECLTIPSQEQMKNWFVSRLIDPLLSAFKQVSESQFQHLSEKMIDYIHQHYHQAVTLEQCAADLHYNANYLSSVFKEGTAMTFSEYLAQYRLKKAKEWLAKTSEPVKTIAEKLGYNNSQNFIRSFKKMTGMTPGQYRQQKQLK